MVILEHCGCLGERCDCDWCGSGLSNHHGDHGQHFGIGELDRYTADSGVDRAHTGYADAVPGYVSAIYGHGHAFGRHDARCNEHSDMGLGDDYGRDDHKRGLSDFANTGHK